MLRNQGESRINPRHASSNYQHAYSANMSTFALDIEAVGDFLAANPRIVVLTGAGISLASGIPTYRDRDGKWTHSEPVKCQEFLTSALKRQRYWARSMRGWPAVRDAQPTDAHRALAKMERLGHIDTIITQNVDRLHQRAGSETVIDLHGRLDRVRCLDCNTFHWRDHIQQQLTTINAPNEAAAIMWPDGHAELPQEAEQNFSVPACNNCGGTLMPDVVFFGDTVPRERLKVCMDALERADAMLVIGSSLQVYSGFRFCRQVNKLGKPLAILNPGSTRADDMANLKVAVDCQKLLSALEITKDRRGSISNSHSD
jgi:NAD-dependent SIR2 family protein deacetylase